ncbi:DUF63 family protein [Natrarchaeobaculum sulfurireducens]|uniref:DUF63 family protein n=1 Tax=Natrarchaeobaculum sulfurireducens TaxID=2044521 RepID=A0A346PS26_9EURY|nr:DUF63 family protein [Natrarchaeobaculum sulfurireducens]AXR77681.1 hypothetical protein AArc1_1344 [Natrarchaeobaculum sulfurireducens]AXR82321.1 hypothetical protein AArcMg_2327 [Natrarchaeobaculum sulfurireducens]
MYDYVERYGPVRVWAVTVLVLAVGITAAALASPRVYVDFIWQYYWGPVVADAHGWTCVDWAGGAEMECNAAAQAGVDTGPTASPGYTFVSYAGYIPTLILLLIGIVFILQWLDIERFRSAFYALFPFMLFGGALRTVEDANVAAYRETGELAIELPWSGFLISPLIYFTVFFIALIALVGSVWLDRRGLVSKYEYPLAGVGTILLAGTVGYLGWVAAFEPYATIYPWLLITTLVGATVATWLTWVAIERFAPDINRGTRYMGLVVIWAHAVDGVANVIGLDWAVAFGHEQNLVPKHPVNEAIVNVTGSILPADIAAVTGAAWPFLFVKLAAAVVVIWIFDETVFEESPRYAILLMITVVAVGLGPGTRDMLRATFGV